MAENLKEKTVTGVIWSALQKSGTILLSFISSIILARLLMPEDYGCIGMLAIFMTLSTTFIDGGFGSALIQKQRPTQEDYSTIFWWNLFLSVIIYALLFFCAPFIARFFHTDILSAVLRVQGLVLIINAMRIVNLSILRKKLNFRAIAVVDVAVAAVSLVLTVFLAWKGAGVWALVGQQLTVSTLTTIAYWMVSKWRPSLLFSKASFKELFGFGGFLLLANLFNNFCSNVQAILIGRFYSAGTMGYYSKAISTEELASTFIAQIMDQVAYPVMAEAQHDKECMIRMVRKFSTVLAFVSFPIMLLLAVLAKPIFIILYSERWAESIPYFQILCFAGIAICMQGITYYAVVAIGKSKAIMNWTFVKRFIGVSLILLGMWKFGINGILVGTCLSAWTIYLFNAMLVSKYIGYKFGRQFADLLPMFLLSGISALVCVGIGFLLPINMYVLAVIQLFVFCIVYVGTSVLLKLEAFESTLEVGKIVLSKFIGKAIRKQ